MNLRGMLSRFLCRHDGAALDVALDEGAKMPVVAHDGDAGYDVFSREDVLIPAHWSHTFNIGVHLALPRGYYARVSPRSGLNVRHGVVTFGSVVDTGYRGSIKVKLYNLSDTDYNVRVGDRIAQLVISPYITPPLRCVGALSANTARGSAGFGSTGR